MKAQRVSDCLVTDRTCSAVSARDWGGVFNSRSKSASQVAAYGTNPVTKRARLQEQIERVQAMAERHDFTLHRDAELMSKYGKANNCQFFECSGRRNPRWLFPNSQGTGPLRCVEIVVVEFNTINPTDALIKIAAQSIIELARDPRAPSSFRDWAGAAAAADAILVARRNVVRVYAEPHLLSQGRCACHIIPSLYGSSLRTDPRVAKGSQRFRKVACGIRSGRHRRIKPMPNDTLDRDAAFRNLIKAAWHFLDHTKNQSQLQDMEEYRDLARAMNEAAQANAK